MSDSNCNCCCQQYSTPPWWVTMGFVPGNVPGGSSTHIVSAPPAATPTGTPSVTVAPPRGTATPATPAGGNSGLGGLIGTITHPIGAVAGGVVNALEGGLKGVGNLLGSIF